MPVLACTLLARRLLLWCQVAMWVLKTVYVDSRRKRGIKCLVTGCIATVYIW